MTLGVPKPCPKPVILRCDEARDWIRRQPCLLGDRQPCECGKYFSVNTRRTPTECCHVRTRRNAGDFENLVPMCGKHHRESHRVGIRTFEHRYQIDLSQLGVQYWDQFVTETRWEPESDTPEK